MKRSVTCALVVSLSTLFFALSVNAQFETSEVLGSVHDASGGAVSKASVALTSQSTGIEAKTTTDDNGNYDFFNVKVGKYTVSAEAPGFSKVSAADVDVAVQARQRVDLTMQVGVVSQTVEVTGAASILETDSSEHGQVINTAQVVELPLNGRNYSDLALLSTNVNKSPMAAAFSPSATPREGALNINGMRSTYNNFLMDGIDNNAYSPSNQGYSSQVVQPSPDAIAEFKVITSNFSAEYGRVGGGVINAVLRSGSNQFHGTAYEFLRNTSLNAVGFTFSPTVFLKPTLQRNQFGATIGGPIIKNKLFFFGDYEGQRQLQSYLNFDSIPSLSDRNGTLINPSGNVPVTVTNPLTGAVYPGGTTIPISQINPFAAAVLGGLPAPNGPSRSNNFEALLLIRDYYDKYDGKLDYQVNSRMNAFLRFSQRKDIQYYAPDIPGPSGGGGNGFIHAIQQQAAAGYTWTITPTSLFEARLGFDHILAGKTPPYLGGASMESLYGISGLPTTSNLTGGLDSQAVGGFNGFGRQSTNPQFQNPTSFNPKFNYSWNHGRHSIKAGYEFIAVRTEVLDVNPLYGSDTYSGQFSKPTCAQISQPAGCTVPGDSTSFNLADFLFGLPSTIGLGNNVVTNQRQHIHSLYAQDDFKVTPKLTLNVGLRWEFATPIWERDNNWTNFDPATNTLIPATNGSLFNRALVHPDYHDFGPRIGLAYSVDPKTVIRAGYGISYSFFNRVGSALENINSPQINFGTLTQSIPAGGPVPAGFLTTQNSFTTGIADPAHFNAITSNVDYVDPNTRWPMVQSWLLSIQKEVLRNTVVEIAYNGNQNTRLPIIADYNQAVPNVPGASLGVQARRPDQAFGPITWVDPAGVNNYNGLSIRTEHRSNGLYLLNSFTWSKAEGDSEQALETFPGYTVANPQNVHNLADEKGVTSFDVTLMDVASVVYDLPFGKGRRFATGLNPIAEAIFGGWEINAINTAHSGPAINVNYGPAAANDVTGSIADYRGLAVLRPNVSGQGIDQSQGQLVNSYFAGYAFTTPPASAPFGNLGRDAFRGPDFWQLDTGINKSFAVKEGIRLQFRSEFFNILNKTNFSPPTATTTSSAFGTIRSTFAPRQIQFALKLLF
ncbi:MAG TPA: TonB-dependent receptor [Bryobacteraceae bacterium]|nr:TonB-dependent receptor [Bryobacteraceae bacterium]